MVNSLFRLYTSSIVTDILIYTFGLRNEERYFKCFAYPGSKKPADLARYDAACHRRLRGALPRVLRGEHSALLTHAQSVTVFSLAWLTMNLKIAVDFPSYIVDVRRLCNRTLAAGLAKTQRNVQCNHFNWTADGVISQQSTN